VLSRLSCLGRVVVCSCFLHAAAPGANVSEFLDFSLRSPRGPVSLPGRLFVPPEAVADPVTKRPLIVWLHGGGDAGTNNINQVRWDVDLLFAEAKRRGAFLYAPQAPQNWRPKSVTDNVMTMLDRALVDYNVDPDRLYLTGYSSGGGGTWNMLSRYPDRFAAAMPVAPVSAEPDFNPANLVGQPISAFHARNDGVAPVQTTRNVINQILTAAGKPTPAYPSPQDPTFVLAEHDIELYYVEPNVGDHSVHFAVYNTPQVYDWMFSNGAPEPASAGLAAFAVVALFTLSRRKRLTTFAAA
jgi:predicted peptidase